MPSSVDDFATCPKAMRFGPCGGVRHDGACEVDGQPCPFLDATQLDLLEQAASSSHRTPIPVDLPIPAIIVDVRAPVNWTGDEHRLWQTVAASLHDCVALLGEHVDNPRGTDDAGRVDPVVAIEALASEGVAVIATVTGRDRDLASARTTMRRYAAAGATAIHCVTGDHPMALSLDRPAVFGAEGVALAELANDLGLAATVGESPASPGPRVERLAVKRAAGAGACILNHSGEAEELVAFAEACRRSGLDLPMVAPIPMVADLQAAAALVRFPGLCLPSGFVEVVAEASDAAEASIALASSMVAELAGSGEFVGVNVSGSATSADPYARIDLTNRFVAAIRNAWTRGHGPAIGDRHEPAG